MNGGIKVVVFYVYSRKNHRLEGGSRRGGWKVLHIILAVGERGRGQRNLQVEICTLTHRFPCHDVTGEEGKENKYIQYWISLYFFESQLVR